MSEREVQTTEQIAKEPVVERNNKKVTHGYIKPKDNGDIHIYVLSKDDEEVKTCNCTNLSNALTNVVVKMRKDSRVKTAYFVLHDNGGIYFGLQLENDEGEKEVKYMLFRDGKEVYSGFDKEVKHTATKILTLTNLIKVLTITAAVATMVWIF